MGWKFWKTDDETDAERSLAQLNAGVLAAPGAEAGSGAAPEASSTGFRMRIEDVFTITGRGTVVTGTIGTGQIRTGQKVSFADASGRARSTTVTGIEMFRALRKEAHAGESVGLLLKGVTKADLAAGVELWA